MSEDPTVAEEARFWAKVARWDPDECWVWTACTRLGYGRIRVGGRGGRSFDAHRLAYAAFLGPIPDGLEVDHLCLNRGCVNPKHLEAVTHRENARRAHRRDACQRGHPRSASNTYVRRSGRRECRPCRGVAAKAKP